MSVETVYATFGSKADLLASALEVANVQVYALLVDECGWSRVRYEFWVIDRIEEVLDRLV